MASYNSYNSSYNSINASTNEYHQLMQQEQIMSQPPPFRNNKKHHIAPLIPTPPKVYKVDPVDFRDVVQKLTGNHSYDQDEFQLTRLQEVAPPPLSLTTHSSSFMSRVDHSELSPLVSLSPSSMAWCSSILMSPGTMSSDFERRT